VNERSLVIQQQTDRHAPGIDKKTRGQDLAKLLNTLGAAPGCKPTLRIDLIGNAYVSRAFKKRFGITGAEVHQGLFGGAIT